MSWFFYDGCASQNVYLYISILIATIFVASIVIMYSIKIQPQPAWVQLINRYKVYATIGLLATFVVVFVINNTLFWWYCTYAPQSIYISVGLWLFVIVMNVFLYLLLIYVLDAMYRKELEYSGV